MGKVRFPVIEGGADLGQRLLTKNIRSLSMTEQHLLFGIFQSSLDYSSIRVADTVVGTKGRPYTLGNTIRVPPGSTLDFRTLVHECTHVWQYQTKGTGYISDSAWHQIMDKSAYQVKIEPRKSFSSYSAENQAVIIEAYYVDSLTNPKAPVADPTYDPSVTSTVPSGWSLNPDVIRMLAEVRCARPMSDDARARDTWGPLPDVKVPGSPNDDTTLSPTVPLFRYQW